MQSDSKADPASREPSWLGLFLGATAIVLFAIALSGQPNLVDNERRVGAYVLDAVHNVVAAGVVPVIAAGNDRDTFGLGTVGSPGSAADAITVGAVSNTHVFDATMSIRAEGAPASLEGIPIASAVLFPPSFGRIARPLVDVSTLTSTSGTPVDRRLCGPDDDPNNQAKPPLARGSLNGAIALPRSSQRLHPRIKPEANQ